LTVDKNYLAFPPQALPVLGTTATASDSYLPLPLIYTTLLFYLEILATIPLLTPSRTVPDLINETTLFDTTETGLSAPEIRTTAFCFHPLLESNQKHR